MSVTEDDLFVDLTEAHDMDPGRITPDEGMWYLRQAMTDDYHVALLSERVPAGTIARDLKPRAISVEREEEGALVFDPDQLRAFLVWPPSEGVA